MQTLDQRLALGPDAEAASMRLERLLETKVQLPEDSAGQTLLAAVLASGTYLPELILSDPERLPRLLAEPWLHGEKPRELFLVEVEAACTGARSLEDMQSALRRHAHGEMLRLGAREIGAGIGTEARPSSEHGRTLEVARELSFLADACLESTVRFCADKLREGFGSPTCRDSQPGFSVIAMGKLGGEELNYSSDIDLIYIYIYASDDGQVGSLSMHEYYTRLSQTVPARSQDVSINGPVLNILNGRAAARPSSAK